MNYNVKNFGAQESTTVLQTKAFQQAVDECFLNGGGKVVVPKGIYLLGSVRLRSDITLYLESGAILLASRNPEDYFEHLNDKIEPLDEKDITDMLYAGTHHNRSEFDANDPIYDFCRKPASRWNNAIIRAIHADNVSIIGEAGSVIDGADCYDEKGEEHYRGPNAIGMFNCNNIILRGYTVQNSANWAHSITRSSNITYRNITVKAGHDGVHLTQCRNIYI